MKKFLVSKLGKRAGLAALTVGVIVAGAAAFSAFEAHVINVTAKIENALSVSADAIDFGTVFPQEHLNQPLTVALSQSFLDEDRVDDVNYFIRQKPKCAITTDNGQNFDADNTRTGEVIPGDNPTTTSTVESFFIDCGAPPRTLTQGETWGVLPSLCPYLSKEDDKTPDNDGSTPSFHVPFTVASSTISWLDTPGHLAKSEQDTSDTWNIDLAAPCFGGFCAQDWATFVHSINPDANPDNFTQPISNEHKVFGCDLWVEVGGISESTTTPTSTTLTVTKIVVNDNGGNATTTDFTLTVSGVGTVTSGVATSVPPGLHTVSETGVGGYDATFGGDCDTDGHVTLAAGDHKACTITNNDIAPNITLIKSVINNNSGTASSTDFTMRVNGTIVPSGGSISVNSNTPNTITEDAKAGYHFVSITGNAKCPAVLGGTATLDEGEAITCTITNDDNAPL